MAHSLIYRRPPMANPIPYDRCIDLAVAEIGRMAELCRGADPAAPVPSCPEWDLAKLLRHAGTIPRWAATMTERRSTERLDRRELDLGLPDDPAELPGWLAGAAPIVEGAFRGADPSASMWAWGTPKAVRFWPRRLIHELGVHRADAELALGRPPTYDPQLAADGIDELLDNLPHAAYFAPAVANLRGDGEVLALVATDTGAAWRIQLDPDGFTWRRGDAGAPEDAGATLALPAAELLLTIYRRLPLDEAAVTGDGAIVDRWLAGTAL
jgi:uncharacterized protein (TIGR03083 family)